jgi:N-glycosylase/DNA lyase
MKPRARRLTMRVRVRGPEIVAPHDFGFQLRHYVVPPEVREGQALVDIVRTRSGSLVKLEVVSCGSVTDPCLELALASQAALDESDIEGIRQAAMWRLGADDDLRPFYARVSDDPVLAASIRHNFGAKAKSASSLFDALIYVICAQNTTWRRLYAMRANLAAAFGDTFATPERTYHASPRPEQLAAARLDAIRACGVGYRDRYIKGVAQAVVDGFDVEAIKRLPGEVARAQLMLLPGVGPYTADLGLVIGARRQDAMFFDVYLREAIRALYFGGDPVAEATLSAFTEERWGHYRGYAWLYLATNTEVWARDLGVELRLRSGALSDPDPGDASG